METASATVILEPELDKEVLQYDGADAKKKGSSELGTVVLFGAFSNERVVHLMTARHHPSSSLRCKHHTTPHHTLRCKHHTTHGHP